MISWNLRNGQACLISSLNTTIMCTINFMLDIAQCMYFNIVKINCVQDNGSKFNSLLTAIGAYAEGFSADPIIRRAFHLWRKLDSR